jgi:hypothetical protein
MCEVISDACLHPSHSGLFTRTGLSRCPFKWQYSISNPVISLIWFLLRLRNSSAFLLSFFSPSQRNPLACLCPHVDCQCSSCFLLVQSLITSVGIFADIPSRGSGPVIGCGNLLWINVRLFHFHQFPCVLEPISDVFCYVLPLSLRIDGSPRLIWIVS